MQTAQTLIPVIGVNTQNHATLGEAHMDVHGVAYATRILLNPKRIALALVTLPVLNALWHRTFVTGANMTMLAMRLEALMAALLV